MSLYKYADCWHLTMYFCLDKDRIRFEIIVFIDSNIIWACTSK